MFSPPFDFSLLSQCPLPVWPDWHDLALTLPPAWARQTARAAAHIPVHRWRVPPAARSMTTRTDRKPWRCPAKAPRTKPPFDLGSSACWTSAPQAAFCPLWGLFPLCLSFVLFVLLWPGSAGLMKGCIVWCLVTHVFYILEYFSTAWKHTNLLLMFLPWIWLAYYFITPLFYICRPLEIHFHSRCASCVYILLEAVVYWTFGGYSHL